MNAELDADRVIRAAADAATRMQGAPAQPGVLPQPVPMSVQLLTTGAGTEKWVVLVISTPVGQNVFHFEPTGAEKIADAIKDAARLARTGLELPKGAI